MPSGEGGIVKAQMPAQSDTTDNSVSSTALSKPSPASNMLDKVPLSPWPSLKDPDERRVSILQDKPDKFEFRGGRPADDSAPFWELPQFGARTVQRYDPIIVQMAEKHGVDADLLRAVMYMENARGHYFGMNNLSDALGLSDSIAPMNINPDLWKTLLNKAEPDFKDPRQNIEAATILLKSIANRLDDPTPEAIASVWNYLGRETTSDIGAYVGRAYREKPWEKQKTDRKKRGHKQ